MLSLVLLLAVAGASGEEDTWSEMTDADGSPSAYEEPEMGRSSSFIEEDADAEDAHFEKMFAKGADIKVLVPASPSYLPFFCL